MKYDVTVKKTIPKDKNIAWLTTILITNFLFVPYHTFAILLFKIVSLLLFDKNLKKFKKL